MIFKKDSTTLRSLGN